MRLSIVELATVAPGTTEADGLADAILTAQDAEALGFHRAWFAEHHLSRSHASHHPELLIAMAGARTTDIRLGSGAVLLNHYSPFKVAEMFQQLEAMLPGRVDLGLGRATGGPVVDAALRIDRRAQPVDDQAQRVSEVVAWLHQAFPAGHPFADQPLMPSVPHVPQTWLLGSSPGGPALAAGLGIGYAFAAFINPQAAGHALRAYRRAFRPTGFGPQTPAAMLAVNVSLGEDADDARRLVASAKGFYARLQRLGITATIPTAQEALRELTPAQHAEPTTIVDGRWPRFVAGDAGQVEQTLRQMLDESAADELMIQNLIADPDDRRASHRRLAELFELPPRRSSAPPPARRTT